MGHPSRFALRAFSYPIYLISNDATSTSRELWEQWFATWAIRGPSTRSSPSGPRRRVLLSTALHPRGARARALGSPRRGILKYLRIRPPPLDLSCPVPFFCQTSASSVPNVSHKFAPFIWTDGSSHIGRGSTCFRPYLCAPDCPHDPPVFSREIPDKSSRPGPHSRLSMLRRRRPDQVQSMARSMAFIRVIRRDHADSMASVSHWMRPRRRHLAATSFSFRTLELHVQGPDDIMS